MPWNCFKSDPARRTSDELGKKIDGWKKEYDKAIKLLLLGTGESGKTTILKQMKIIHDSGFTNEERLERIIEIRMNVLLALKELLEIMQLIRPNISLANSNSFDSAKYIQEMSKSEITEFKDEFFQHATILWEDSGVKRCLDISHEFPIIDSAKYFLDRISLIQQADYVPSDQDILFSRKRTNDIKKIEFRVKIPAKYGGGSQLFWMFDVGGQRGERRKWIQVFAGIRAVLFLVACNSFDSKIREDYETNSLEESFKLFGLVWRSKFLMESSFILFLNKQDLLEEKIRKGISIVKYFPEYAQYKISRKDRNNTDEFVRTQCFIKDKFLEITKKSDDECSLFKTSNPKSVQKNERHCFWHFTTATDTNNVQRVFDDVHTMIILENLNDVLK